MFFPRSLDDPDLDESLPDDTRLTFEEVAGGTKRAGTMLLSSDGYSYTVKVCYHSSNQNLLVHMSV